MGNVKPNKNLRRLIAAFGSIIDLIPHHLLIIGRHRGFGTGDDGIEEIAKPFGERIRFAGALDDAAVRDSVAHASLLVVPSLYEGGFLLPALEAMAAGCPVAAARIAALIEICGEAANYFEPLDVRDMAQTILRMLEDDTLRQHLILKGLDRALQFSWEAGSDALGALIVGMLAFKAEGTWLIVSMRP